jgi:hypothetical protein
VTAILAIPYAIALVLFAAEVAGKPKLRRLWTPPLPSGTWLALLLATYAVQLATIYVVATHDPSLAGVMSYFPLPVVSQYCDGRAAGEAIVLVCALLQSYALLALYRSNVSATVTRLGCAALLLLSVAAPALSSFDVYGYVHDSLLSLAAYAPPSTPFPAPYHAIDVWFKGTNTSLYGPLWLAIVGIVMPLAGTLLAKILVWRLFCTALYLAFLGCLAQLRLPWRVRVVAALNPAIVWQFVSNGHNDLIPIVFLLLAALFVRSRVALAYGFFVLAALVKLPYALLGLPIFAAIRSRGARVAGTVLAMVAIAALSWGGGGNAYVHALAHHARLERNVPLQHAVATSVAVLLLLIAFWGGRRFRTAVWLIPPIGGLLPSFFFPWYLGWSIPYALARHRVMAYLLVWFPLVGALVYGELLQPWTLLVVFPLLAIMALSPSAEK